MEPRRLVAPLVVAAAVGGGAVAGALVGVPALSGAQETTTTTPTEDGTTTEDGTAHPWRHGGGMHGGGMRGGGHHGGMRHGPALDAAADAIGIEVTDLIEELRAGKTIAEVAGEHDVDVDTVVDAMVADVRERVEEYVNEGPQFKADDDTDGTDGTDDTDGSDVEAEESSTS